MREFGSSPIVVTGASGWVGRTVLEHLAKQLPPDKFRSRVRAFSSRAGVIEHVEGMSIPTMPLTELPSLVDQEGCSTFLHAAFLTPDRCAEFGTEAYVNINRSIIEIIVTAVQATTNARVVEFSSGAAAYAESNQVMSYPAANLYGVLKLEEEHRLQDVATTLVLRIYALTGRHIRQPLRYAIGDFIDQALRGGPLLVESRHRVVRGYVHADCLAEAAISWLLSDAGAPKKALNAITHEVNLVDLAKCVAAAFGDLSVAAVDQSPDGGNIYYDSPEEFLDLLKYFNVDVPSLGAQIRDTAIGVR